MHVDVVVILAHESSGVVLRFMMRFRALSAKARGRRLIGIVEVQIQGQPTQAKTKSSLSITSMNGTSSSSAGTRQMAGDEKVPLVLSSPL